MSVTPTFENQQFSKQDLAALQSLLAQPKKIVVTNHINPDGDAMGSALGWAKILTQLGHQVQVIVPNAYPNYLHWLPGNADVIVAEMQMSQAKLAFKEAAVIFSLDYNDPSRAGDLEKLLVESTATKVLIDHHQQPTGFAQLNFWDTSSCATAQLVFELAAMMGWLTYITPDVAHCLYTGILTDTGSFRFRSTTARTHHIAAHCIQKGVDPDAVYNALFNQSTIARFKLLGTMLARIEIFPEYNTALLYLKLSELEAAGYEKGDTEGFVNYGLSIAGIQFSAFFVEREHLVKASFRSKAHFDVNAFARAHYNGGGHINAAGGAHKEGLESALTLFRKSLPNYASTLQNV
jgi:bifunctional oligoribonuclease and PAP phosphatase NrnA